MVWKTSNLFSGISCPEMEACTLISCMFSHEPPPTKASPQPSKTAQVLGRVTRGDETTRSTQSKQQFNRKPIVNDDRSSNPKSLDVEAKQVPNTLKRTISPPPSQSPIHVERPAKVQRCKPPTSLNPRLVPKAPVQHDKRTLVLKTIHAELVKTNQAMSSTRSDPTAITVPSLTPEELILAAVEEEECVALNEGSTYMNTMRSQIRQYKTMTPESWMKQIAKLFPEKQSIPTPSDVQKQVDDRTGGDLTYSQEVQLLPFLLASNLPSLAAYGYIFEVPSNAQVDEANAAAAMSQNYENCDRCTARFQVFPTRDATGRLTTNGPCHFHPERPQRPAPLGKAQSHLAGSGTHHSVHPCCNEPRGSRGCTEHEHHVFKTTSVARLASLLSFIPTPNNSQPATDQNDKAVDAVVFDCEMGYTTLGYEVLRLSAVTWPQGKCLIDILVRPFGIVLDFNTRYSGVSQVDFDAACPYKRDAPPMDPASLMMAESPAHAREILCSYLTPATPLIGHAIENDLSIIRLCHKAIVDTVLLYPHRLKLPYRQRLRHLVQKYLGRDIQSSDNSAGHNSLEDSIATGELVRVKVQEKWKALCKKGWTAVDGRLTGPPGSDAIPSTEDMLDDARRTKLNIVASENDKRDGNRRNNNGMTSNGEPTLAQYLEMAVERP